MKKRLPVVFMFSGQGSQYYQMGRDLYDSNPIFREVMQKGDIIIQQSIHRSIIFELYGHRASDQFDDLILTHPALVLVECAIYQVLVSEGLQPDYVWGSSLGEFASAVAAGIWSLETALVVAIEQARNIVQYCPDGGMIAIFSSQNLYNFSNELRQNTTLAGVNYDKQFTIAANNTQLEFAERHLKNRDASYLRLPVRYAFHSANIDDAKGSFEVFCETLPQFEIPKIQIYSSMTTEKLSDITWNHFWEAVRQPVHFQKTFSQLEKREHCMYIDCGPSGTLAAFIKNNLASDSKSLYFSTLTRFQNARRQIDLINKESAKQQ